MNSFQSHLLLSSVFISSSFPAHVIHEFYNNLTILSLDVSSEWYNKMFLRGVWYSFSPLIINQFFGREDVEETELSANLDQISCTLTADSVSIFPQEGIPALNLTTKYAILHKIVLLNWMPIGYATTVREELAELLYRIGRGIQFDLGTIIYNQVYSFVE